MTRNALQKLKAVVAAFSFVLANAHATDAPLTVAVLDFRLPPHNDTFRQEFLRALQAEPKLAHRRIDLQSDSVDLRAPSFKLELTRLLSKRPAVLYATTTTIAKQARELDPQLPIVFSGTLDPVAIGLVSTAARPGNGMTGFTTYSNHRLQRASLLFEALAAQGKRGKVGFIDDISGDRMKMSARELPPDQGARLVLLQPTDAMDGTALCQAIRDSRLEGVVVETAVWTRKYYRQLATCFSTLRIPSLYFAPDFLVEGNLMSYGIRDFDYPRKAAALIARIASGEPAGEIPIEYQAEMDFAINLSTARKMTPPLPSGFMRRATLFID